MFECRCSLSFLSRMREGLSVPNAYWHHVLTPPLPLEKKSGTTQLQLASNPNNFCIIPIQILISTAQKQIILNIFFCVELLFRAVFYWWSLFILAMSLLMGCYASLNKLKLSSILLMIMADTLWLILSEKQGILIL